LLAAIHWLDIMIAAPLAFALGVVVGYQGRRRWLLIRLGKED
jgi:hypothetical protein